MNIYQGVLIYNDGKTLIEIKPFIKAISKDSAIKKLKSKKYKNMSPSHADVMWEISKCEIKSKISVHKKSIKILEKLIKE